MATGAIKEDRLPSRIANPRSINTKPKYIGWRLILNGPLVINTEGVSNGLTVVLSILNASSAQIFKSIPETISTRPTKFKGLGIILAIGKIK